MKAVNSQKLTQQCRHSSHCVLSLAGRATRPGRECKRTHTQRRAWLIGKPTSLAEMIAKQLFNYFWNTHCVSGFPLLYEFDNGWRCLPAASPPLFSQKLKKRLTIRGLFSKQNEFHRMTSWPIGPRSDREETRIFLPLRSTWERETSRN